MDTGLQNHRKDGTEPDAVRSVPARAALPRRAVRVSAVCTLFLTVFMSLFWTGCEVKVTRTNYKTLSRWFDGVPDPDAPEGSMRQRRKGTTLPVRAQIVSHHKPYVEEKCAECHANKGDRPEFGTATASCVKCHDKVAKQYPVMHGPVVSNACLWCHSPHESTLPALLRTDSTQLCTQCHDRRVLSPETAEHQTEKKGCLECHTGHGGTDRRMLKAPGISPGPTTQPAPTLGPTATMEKGG